MSKEHKGVNRIRQGVCWSFIGALAFSAIGIAPFVYGQTSEWTWQSETVDTSGRFPDIAVDSMGSLHVSYIQATKGVMYAFRPAGDSKWFKMVIDPKVGPSNETTGIAVGPQGNPFICSTPGPLKVSSFDGKEWKTELIGTNTFQLEYTCSIAISKDGTPQIIWYQTHNPDGTLFNHIRYATLQNGVWTLRTVDFDFETGKWNSLYLDSQGIPHLSYSSLAGGELRYATLDGDKWHVNIIDSRNFRGGGSYNRGLGSSLILDKDGKPQISYYNDSLLKFAHTVDGVWKTEVVDHVSASGAWSAYRSSIVLDSNGLPHICYEDSGAIKHAFWNGSVWKIQIVTPSAFQPRWPSMAIDGHDTLYIVYRDPSDDTIKVAVGTPTRANEKTSATVSN